MGRLPDIASGVDAAKKEHLSNEEHPDMGNEFMTKPLSPQKEYYSESEAARFLNISLAHLYMLLDEFVFNDGSVRPMHLTFRDSDLVLLEFWSRSHENPKVIRMPKRN